jgi:aldehyde:ferredoxin oxidoreductase
MLDEYYALSGWGNDGVPTPEKLHSMDLDVASREIHGDGG